MYIRCWWVLWQRSMGREGRECGVGRGDCDVIYTGCLCKAILLRWHLCRDLMEVEKQATSLSGWRTFQTEVTVRHGPWVRRLLGMFSSVQSFSRVLTLCDPMDCSTPGLPVHYQLPQLAQTQVHWVGDAIQPSHALSCPSLPAFDLSQHCMFRKWQEVLHGWSGGSEVKSQRSWDQGGSKSRSCKA